MNSPTWKPIRKVLLAFAAAVIVPGIIGILSLGTDLINLSGQEWVGIVISTFIPPIIAYLSPHAKGDIPKVTAKASAK